jgi:hypothetical protein
VCDRSTWASFVDETFSCQALFSLVFFFSVERKSGFLACGVVHHISLFFIYDLVDRVTFFSGFSDGAEVNNAGNWWEKVL